MPINPAPDNNTQFKDKGVLPPKLDIEMSDQDYNKLLEAVKNEKTREFIVEYQKTHNSLNDEDIINIGLNKFINNYDPRLDVKILLFLAVDLLYLKRKCNLESIVTLDKHGNTPIYYALKEDVCIGQIMNFISTGPKVNPRLSPKKFTLDDDLIKKIASVMHKPKYEAHPNTIIKKIFAPLYTEESIEKLIGELDQDWLDNYYS